MDEPINESGMTFGPFPGCCFAVESCNTYKGMKGVKMVEFLLLRPELPSVWLVEAKQSSPQESSQIDFGKYIQDMRDKFANGLLLGIASCLNRHPDLSGLPESFRDINLGTVRWCFVLVIKNHKPAWLRPLKVAIEKALSATLQTWGIPKATSVVVLNEALARTHGLILN